MRLCASATFDRIEVLKYLEMSQDLVAHQQEFEAHKAKLAEAIAALAALQEQKREADAEFRRTNYGHLFDAENKAASLAAQWGRGRDARISRPSPRRSTARCNSSRSTRSAAW